MTKIVITTLFILQSIYSLITFLLSRRMLKRPLPENVKDVYSEEEYTKYSSYKRDCAILDLSSMAADFVLNLLFLVLNLYWHIFSLFTGLNTYLAYSLLVLATSLLSTIVKLPFSYYDTFVIEEKYGMNNTTKRTFLLDRIKAFVVSLCLSLFLLFLMIFFFSTFKQRAVILAVLTLTVLSLIINSLVMPLMKLFNKFTPLEDGELKEKLTALCTKYGVKVKKIVVKDASRRTTKANAFCTGLRKKTISIDDNLMNNFTTDEISAVFAHEFAHAKYHHIIKSLPLSVVSIAAVIVAFSLTLEYTPLFTAFGFNDVNYYFAIVLLETLLWPIGLIWETFANWISRKHEYEADAFAAREGYGEALIKALKRLTNESLSSVNPHPWIVMTEYSHPTLSERIEAIRRYESRPYGQQM